MSGVKKIWILSLVMGVFFISGVAACQAGQPGGVVNQPAQPPVIEPTHGTVITTAAEEKPRALTVSFPTGTPDFVPDMLVGTMALEVVEENNAKIRVAIKENGSPEDFSYLYALAATFTTLRESLTLKQWQAIWQGNADAVISPHPLLVRESDLPLLEVAWGKCGYQSLKVVSDEEISAIDWREPDTYAVLPFEMLNLSLKPLTINGQNLLDKHFDPDNYPLSVWFAIQAADSGLDAGKLPAWQPPASNRDETKLVRLLTTGVTALVRRLGSMMETRGMDYPISEIEPWFEAADIIHISNEVSFNQNCPPADWYQTTVQFCSRPEYLELLDAISPDVIELSGNHLIDYDIPPFVATLDMLHQRGWQTFAGGMNQAEALTAAILEAGGHKFAFIGCNDDGPDYVFASDSRPGSAVCDFDFIESEVRRLAAAGAIPIVSIQLKETYAPEPTPYQSALFERMRTAGAVIVQGTQAHVPLSFSLQDGSFLHYGLSNFLFDQMKNPPELGQEIVLDGESYPAVRLVVADLHTFYDGKLINTLFVTGILENYAHIRPLTSREREDLLNYLFSVSR